jgi:hypothetical protein
VKKKKKKKKMPIEMPEGLPFSVDTWTPSSKISKRHHFLTHAHKDHSSNIISNSSFPIYSTLLFSPKPFSFNITPRLIHSIHQLNYLFLLLLLFLNSIILISVFAASSFLVSAN